MSVSESLRPVSFDRLATPEVNRDFSTAMLTPGQGSQSVGMGAELARWLPTSAGDIWKMAERELGPDFTHICREGPEEELMRTENTQPAVVVDSLARKAALDELKLFTNVGVYTGNSLGWYTAAINVGSLSPAEGAKLVRDRGGLVRNAGDTDSSLLAVLDGGEGIYQELMNMVGLYLCLDNAPNQKVFGGKTIDLQKAAEWVTPRLAKDKVKILTVDGAFHSPIMEVAVEPMRRRLERVEILPPQKGVLIGICDVRPLITPEEIKQEMLAQFTHTVKWRTVMEYLRQNGVVTLLELGNTPRLTNMNTDLFAGDRERIAPQRIEGGPRPPTIAYIRRALSTAA